MKKKYIFFFLFQLLLLWSFYALDGLQTLDDILYYCLLCFCAGFLFLFFLYIKQRRLYDYFTTDKTSEKPSQLGSDLLSRQVQQKWAQNYDQSQQKLLHYKQSHEEHLVFIDKWVHYLKTPLASIRVLTQQHNDESSYRQIQTESDKILHGVNMALYFARTTQFSNDFKFQSLNLKCLVVAVVNDLKHTLIQQQVYPQVNIEEDCNVYSDKKWLSFIIYQLCNNAIRYSHTKGRLLIYTQTKEEQLWLCIEDQGVGIPQQEHERIFDQFYTGSNGRTHGESTGIGLYLVKKICDKMGYPIHLESKVNEGSIFSIGLSEHPERFMNLPKA
jgi:signal transduction histidine kinase